MRRIAPLLPIIACCGTWASLASGSFSLGIFLSLAAVLGTALALGVAAVSWIDEGDSNGRADFLHCFLIGGLALALGLYFLALLCPLGIAANFLALAAAAGATAASRKVRDAWERLGLSRAGWLALSIALAGVTLWSQENLRCLSIGPDAVVLRPWIDAIYHGLQIGLFAHSEGGARLTSPMMHGAPLPLYHYAGYLPASLLVELSGVDALSAATGFYAPFGGLLCALAAYAFGALLLGPAAGAFAAAGLVLVPDPSFYRLGTPWTSYHFFQQIAAGGAYAVAAWALATAYLIRSCGSGDRRQWLASLALAAGSAFFKVQIFLAYSYAFALFGLLFFFRWTWRRKIAAWGALTACCCLVVARLRRLPRAPTLSFSASGAAGYLRQIVSTFSAPNIFWRHHVRPGGYPTQLAAGMPLVSLSIYGLWTLAAPGLFCLAWRRRTAPDRLLRTLLAFSVLVYVNHLTVALGTAPNVKYGDAYEVLHKTFVFPYFIIVVSASCLASLIDWADRRRRIAAAALATALLAFDASAGRGLQSRFWRENVNVALPRGLYDAAVYLRSHAAERDVVQYSSNDRLLALASWSERPSFAAAPVLNAPPPDDEYKRRFQQVDDMISLPNFDAVRARAAALGIDWLVVKRDPGRTIPFTREAIPDFASGEFQVYRLSRF